MDLSNLRAEIISHKKVIAVYGLGNVGAPIACTWLRVGAKLIGVDISSKLISDIKNGISHQAEPFVSETLTKALSDGFLELTSDGIEASKNSDIKIIIVPVAIDDNKIDLKSLLAVSNSVGDGLKKGDIVIVSPSLPPGTTRKVILPILEKKSGLKGDDDFYLIYNPERIYEGRAIQDIEVNYPAIVAGLGKNSTEIGKSLLDIIAKKGVTILSSLENAEAEKLFEGVYRDVNIALANELADFCEKMGINFWESRKAANSQPYCHLHYPGTGVGGLCIPIYPQFVLSSAKEIGKNLQILEYSRFINDAMPKKCVSDALELLKNKELKKSKIAVLGLGFRGDVTDSRLSPTYAVIKEFIRDGHDVVVHDPFILHDENLPSSVILSPDLKLVTHDADLIFISTDHKQYSQLTSQDFINAKKPLVIYDGRNILNKNNFQNLLIKTLGVNS